MPLWLKRSAIIPLFKKPGLVKDEMKSYRPIFNLPFISKLIEKVVARCIEEQLELMTVIRLFIVEMALLKV